MGRFDGAESKDGWSLRWGRGERKSYLEEVELEVKQRDRNFAFTAHS